MLFDTVLYLVEFKIIIMKTYFYTKQHYTMDGKPELWKVAYYPLLECGKTGEVYQEPRALIERPIKGGIDFREVPLRYLTAN